MVDMEAIAQSISERAADIIANLVKKGIIDRSIFLNYEKMSEANLHSWLQYALIKAADEVSNERGLEMGLRGLPEVRVRFEKPLDPEELLPGRDGRKRSQKRVDVGFFLGRQFLGFGECFTLDEFHGCIPTRELVNLLKQRARQEGIDLEKVVNVRKMWITPRDTLIHMVKNAKDEWKPCIAILVLTLPNSFSGVKLASNIHHRLLVKKGAKFFVEKWRLFLEELRKHELHAGPCSPPPEAGLEELPKHKLHAHLIRITDKVVEVDGQIRVIF